VSRDEELDEELTAHLRMAEADRIARGEPPALAAANARREFGNIGLVKEITREMWRGARLERWWQDLTFGLRMLRRNPGFAMLAILCLTIGIGANATVYGWVEGLLLRPYPAVYQQDRLLVLAETKRGSTGYDETSWPDFLDLQRRCRLIDAFIGEKITGVILSIGDRQELATGSMVSANYFDAMGVRPILGRGFLPGEDVGRNAHAVTVISYRLWQEKFRGDPDIIGRQQNLNGVPFTIVGVAPEAFYGTFVGYPFQFWVPASMQALFDGGEYKLEDRGSVWLEPFVRLKPGVTRQQAEMEIAGVMRELERAYPPTNRGRGMALLPLWQSPFNQSLDMLPMLRIALGVAAFVLLIACANVGNLLMVRSLARRHELTVRLAIGAGRRRLVAQLLTESLILSGCAAIGGCILAYACRNVLSAIFSAFNGMAYRLPAEIDWRVLALSAGICAVSTIAFGLVPALLTSRVDLAGALRSVSASVAGGAGSFVRAGMVLVQVALSFMLLVSAGLVVRSVARMRDADPGFATRDVLLTGLNLVAVGYDTVKATEFQDNLLTRVQALGGVQSAALARVAPFTYATFGAAPVTFATYQPAPDEQPTAQYNQVGPGYFATLGIPLVSGREFTRADDTAAARVAIVNETMVVRYWGGVNPVGTRFKVRDDWVRVVGVAKDAKYESFREPAKPFFYVPLRQQFAGRFVVFLRTKLAPHELAAPLRNAVHAIDPLVSPAAIETMRESMDRTNTSQRIAVLLLGLFGGLALGLAAVGLYGLMAYSVSQTGRELGLRVALGAKAADIMRLVVSQGLVLTAGGLVVGALGALALTRLMTDLLYQVSPRDPRTFAAALAVMVTVAGLACIRPAIRAASADPLRVLRD
jgi:macrolide transport system ATP-binding/permease protein